MSGEEPSTLSRLAEELVGDFRGLPFEESRRTKKRPTQPLTVLVEQLMVQHQIGRPSPEQAIRDNWVAIVGVANAQHSHAARIERNRLLVLAAHSVVRNELFHHREEIARRIRALPGCDHVKSINLRAG